MNRYTILSFMSNRPGVLNKITILIRKKMYNIDTLTVCETADPNISRMTISLRSDSEIKVVKMAKQIEKIVEVISAEVIEHDRSFVREVALIKVRTSHERLNELEKEFFIKLLDTTKDEHLIQIAGTIDAIDEFIKQIGKENIIEIARTGPTAIKVE